MAAISIPPSGGYLRFGPDTNDWLHAHPLEQERVRVTLAATGAPPLPATDEFIVHAGDEGVALQTLSGQWLTAAPRLAIGDAPQHFRVFSGDDEGAEQTHCCGRAPSARLMWDERRHWKIVTDAVSVVQSAVSSSNSSIAAHAKSFMNKWPDIREQVKQALVDADEKAEYTGTHLGLNAYFKHFFDPDIRATFQLGGVTAPENAMTEFLRYFYRSLYLRDVGDWNGAGYELGLALHYLTDLTQPMHAANFTNWPPFDWRHQGFETAAESTFYDFGLLGLDLSKYSIGQWQSAGHFLTEVANISKSVFRDKVKPVADGKVGAVTMHGGGLSRLYENQWTYSEVRPILEVVLPFAIERTAMFLVYWMGNSTYGVVDAIYTRVLGRPTGWVDDSGLATWGGNLRSGMPMREVVRHVALSEESINGLKSVQTDEAIRLLYRRLLARDCAPDEIAGWRGWINQKRYADSINFFINGAEYNMRFGPYVLPYPLS